MTTMAAGVEEAAQELREEGFDVEIREEGGVPMLLIHEYPLPPGWSQATTDLLLQLPKAFPNGKPDMFWTETGVTLDDGSAPKKAEVTQTHLDKEWRRFSWHPQSWTPATDNIWTFLEFIDGRLRKAE